MKKAKTFAILGATALSLGILSTSIAMYIKTPEEQEITIGGIYQADGDYVIGAAQVNGELAPDQDVTIESSLGLDNTTSNYTQSVAVGKISVDLTFSSETFKNAVDVTAVINNYYDGNYFANNNTLDSVTSESSTTVSFEGTKPFEINGTQSVLITVSLKDSVTDTDFINSLAEESYSYTISLTEPDEIFDYAYVVGTFNNWTISTEYQMVPSLDSWDTTWTWKYEGLKVANADEFKARMGSDEIWSANEEAGGNYVVDLSYLTSYSDEYGLVVRWSGSSSDRLRVEALTGA